MISGIMVLSSHTRLLLELYSRLKYKEDRAWWKIVNSESKVRGSAP